MTVFGSHGRARTDEFGDAGYVPQGYGRYLENTGSGDLEAMTVFNRGRYKSVSLDGRQFRSSPALHQIRRAGKRLRQVPQRRGIMPE